MKTVDGRTSSADEIERLIREAAERGDLVTGRALVERDDAAWAARPDAVAEVGRRVAALADLCERQVAGRVRRLHAGLDAITAVEGDPDRAAWRASAVAYWPTLRAEVADLFRDAWLAAHRIAGLHSRLSPEARAEAERRFGRLSEAPGKYGTLWRAHWPAGELARADERARAAGIVDAPPTNATLVVEVRVRDAAA